MAVERFTDAGIYYNGWNLTGQSNKVALMRKVAMLDTSVFGVETRINSPGQDETEVSVSGWWYAQDVVGTQAPDPNLFNKLGDPEGRPFLLTAKASVDLSPSYFFPVVESAFNFFGAFGELAPFDATFNYSAYGPSGTRVPHCRGVLGLPLAARTSATGNGTYQQLTPAFGSGDFLVLCVHLISTDATTVTFEVESDDNTGFSSPTSRLSSGALTSGGSYIGSLQGPIATDTYFRVKYTRSGGTTFTAVAAFGKTTPAGLGV
jgi:hypothetical protein